MTTLTLNLQHIETLHRVSKRKMPLFLRACQLSRWEYVLTLIKFSICCRTNFYVSQEFHHEEGRSQHPANSHLSQNDLREMQDSCFGQSRTNLSQLPRFDERRELYANRNTSASREEFGDDISEQRRAEIRRGDGKVPWQFSDYMRRPTNRVKLMSYLMFNVFNLIIFHISTRLQTCSLLFSAWSRNLIKTLLKLSNTQYDVESTSSLIFCKTFRKLLFIYWFAKKISEKRKKYFAMKSIYLSINESVQFILTSK